MRAHGSGGLTLLELLLVVVILAALATAAVASLDQTDAQTRFEETRARSRLIVDAVEGPAAQLNGGPLLSGFVADMGRLPASLSELTSQGALAGYVDDFEGASIGAGWRGPYVRADADGTFRDGWANPSASATSPDPDFGWVVAVGGSPFASFAVTSLGSDGAPGPAPGGTPWDAVDYGLAVAPDDWLVRVSSWQVDVVFTNASAQAWSGSVRLRIECPTSGADATLASAWPASPAACDAAAFLTPALAVSVPTSSTGTRVTFSFVDPASQADKRVPIGVRSLAVVDAATGAAVGRTRPVPIALAARANLPLLAGPAATPLAWTVP